MPTDSTPTAFESAIYSGIVRHRRFAPTQHQFDYSLSMLLLKISEIPRVLDSFWPLGSGRLSWLRFRREDYLGASGVDLETAVKDKIAELTSLPRSGLTGDVFMLAQLRCLGFYFSPLNLYYLRQGDEFRYLLAEVSNTPWNERHYYVLDLQDIKPHAKAFHVSPFNPMQQQYHWRVIPPSPVAAPLLVHIEAHPQDAAGHRVFDASLMLQRHPLNQTELRRVLLKSPMQTLGIALGIYWQALRLFLKRTPLYAHPRKQATANRLPQTPAAAKPEQ